MGADFSRIRFDPRQDFAGVDLQQGRALLDADFNELVDIIDRRMRAAAADLASPGVSIGPGGTIIDNTAVVPQTTPDGFKITPLSPWQLGIGVGRMYVDGILVENHGRAGEARLDAVLGETVNDGPTADGINVTYGNQPYWPTPDPLPSPSQSGNYLVYLDVWQREVTPLQNPDLVESALGVDTTTRVQNVWQAGVLPAAAATTCASTDPAWTALTSPSAARLTTTPVPVEPSTDPCVLPPTSGYRGLENQLYRVQIHTAGEDGKTGTLANASFKWSRENASVATAATAISRLSVTVATLGKDNVLRISAGDWVEITDDHREFNQRSGELRKVATVDDATKTLTFSDPLDPLPTDLIPSAPDTLANRHTRVIRWDQSGTVRRPDGTTVVDLDAANATGAIPTDGSQIVLENGIAVNFCDFPSGGKARAGDYWVFAARTADTSIELLDQAPPRGIHHHYARLAVVTVTAGAAPQFSDCRQLWPQTCEGGGCECTICLTPTGPTTLQDAVNQLQTTGGTICLTNGTYTLPEPVVMNSCQNIRIRGEGNATILIAHQGAFTLTDCVGCTIEDLAITSVGEKPQTVAVAFAGTATGTTLQRTTIRARTAGPGIVENPDLALPPPGSVAVALDGTQNGLTIRENVISGAVGITTAPHPTKDRSLSVSGLRIQSNVLSCAQAGVDIQAYGDGGDGYVVEFRQTADFHDNTVLASESKIAATTGITVVGSTPQDGTVRITNNYVQVYGDAIAASASNVVVSTNTIIGMPRKQNLSAIGIKLMDAPNVSEDAPAAIAHNVVWDKGPAIEIGSIDLKSSEAAIHINTRLLTVEHNTIGNADTAGIIAHTNGVIDVDNNRILNLMTTTSILTAAVTMFGIAVTTSGKTSITDNTIGAENANGHTFGILAKADVTQLSRNQITGPARLGSFTGVAVLPGIRWVDISHNQIDAGDSAGGVTALTVSGGAATSQVGVGLINVTNNTMRVGHGSVKSSVANISGATDLQFSNNSVSITGEVREPAVILAVNLAGTARCQGNVVHGGNPSITISDPAHPGQPDFRMAILGNMTTTPISVPGGLQAPWAALNVTPI